MNANETLLAADEFQLLHRELALSARTQALRRANAKAAGMVRRMEGAGEVKSGAAPRARAARIILRRERPGTHRTSLHPAHYQQTRLRSGCWTRSMRPTTATALLVHLLLPWGNLRKGRAAAS
jgi:hypothetical protein